MKKTLSITILLGLVISLFAQNSSNSLLSQSKFRLSEIGTTTHALSDETIDLQLNLKDKRLRIDDKYYSFLHKGIETFLVDDEKNIYASILGNKLHVGAESYVIKKEQLLSKEGVKLGQYYGKYSKGTYFIGVSRSPEVSDLTLALFYYIFLMRIKLEDPALFLPIIFSPAY